MRFARRFGLGESDLRNAVQGECDADLVGGVFKFRMARKGEGRSGGARAIVAVKVGVRMVLMFGFEKKDRANIEDHELRAFRKAARVYLGYGEEEMTAIVRKGALLEFNEPGSRKGERHGKGI